MTEERLVWTGRPSQVLNMKAFVFCTICSLTVVLAPIAAPIALWKYLEIRGRLYELTSQRLKSHAGILSKKINELELYRVNDTQLEQPFFLRIFGLANILLLSSDTTTPTMKIEAVSKAHELREEIRRLVEECRDTKRVRLIE